eukprot:7375875-Prymnesium_polylepis.1
MPRTQLRENRRGGDSSHWNTWCTQKSRSASSVRGRIACKSLRRLRADTRQPSTASMRCCPVPVGRSPPRTPRTPCFRREPRSGPPHTDGTQPLRCRPGGRLVVPCWAGLAGLPRWRRLVCVDGARLAPALAAVENSTTGTWHARCGSWRRLVISSRAGLAADPGQVGLEHLGCTPLAHACHGVEDRPITARNARRRP